jgi:signal transduction histidine kinase
MRLERGLQTLLLPACSLFDCSYACLFLSCSDVMLRHPLLAFLPSDLSLSLSGNDPALVRSLFENEYLLTRMDLAMLQNQVTCLDISLMSFSYSIALAPLERPSGLLGLLILVDTRSQAFLAGEQRVLSQFSTCFAVQVENVLSEACTSSISPPLSTAPFQDQSTFISMMSHELRTPLTAIKGYAALLQAYGSSSARSELSLPSPSSVSPLSPALQQQYVQGIIGQVHHFEILLADLLDTARLHAGLLFFRRLPVDVMQLCQQATALMQQRIEQQRSVHHLSCHFAPLPLVALADPTRLQQVLMNLLENAVKYSPDGGPIDLFAYKQRSSATTAAMICVTIRDHGIGIPLARQAMLFRPFSRVSSDSLHIDGSGLGLYISRLLVEAMGGTILLQSSEELGTRVTFFLPQAE